MTEPPPATSAGRRPGVAIELRNVVCRAGADSSGAGVSLQVPSGQSLVLLGQPYGTVTALLDVIAGRLLAEFAPTAGIAVAAAALAGYAIGAALSGRLELAWLLLCVLVAVAAVIPRARRLLPAAKGGGPAGAPPGDWSPWWVSPWWVSPWLVSPWLVNLWRGRPRTRRSTRPGRPDAPARLVGRRLRSGSRRLLRTLMIVGASVALSLQVAARWAFAGAATSWSQRPLTGQGTLVDGAAVFIVVLMATFTVADLAVNPLPGKGRRVTSRRCRSGGRRR